MKRVCLMILLTLGCSLTRPREDTPSPAPTSIGVQVTASPDVPIQEAGWLLEGACYEGMASLHNQILILSDAAALNGFYNGLDTLCPEPMPRQSFDFTSQVLVVAVMVVTGCDAQLNAAGLENDQLMLQFVQSGDCPFDVIATFAGTVQKPTTGELQVTVNDA